MCVTDGINKMLGRFLG